MQHSPFRIAPRPRFEMSSLIPERSLVISPNLASISRFINMCFEARTLPFLGRDCIIDFQASLIFTPG